MLPPYVFDSLKVQARRLKADPCPLCDLEATVKRDKLTSYNHHHHQYVCVYRYEGTNRRRSKIVKIKLFLCLIKRHTTKTWRYLYAFLTSALDGCECSASRPVHFIPWEIAPSYPLDMRLIVPQNRLGHCGEKKISCPFRKPTPIL
jgi:hypothetical protein